MAKERNLVFVPAREGKPAHYLTEITLNYKRVRRFAGYTKEEARAYLAKLRIAAREGKLDELISPQPAGDTFGEYARGEISKKSIRNDSEYYHPTRVREGIGGQKNLQKGA